MQAKDREKMALLQQQLGEKEQQIQEVRQRVSVAVELCVVTRGPPDCRRLS